MKTCYIYARTATISQSESLKGKSKAITQQIKECKNYAKENGYDVSKTFSEVASGATLERKELKKLLNYCKRVHVDAVIIHRVHNLSRNFLNYQEICKKLNELNIELISVVEGNLNSPVGRFLGSIHSAVAEYELERSKGK